MNKRVIDSPVALAIAAIFFGVVGIILFATHIEICGAPFLLAVLMAGGIWYYKFGRHRKPTAAAPNTVQQAAQPPVLEPPQTNKSSGRMFVPPPIDDRPD